MYKYIWEVILYMIVMGQGRLGPDIWLETADQVKGIKDMIKTVWAEKVYG